MTDGFSVDDETEMPVSCGHGKSMWAWKWTYRPFKTMKSPGLHVGLLCV